MKFKGQVVEKKTVDVEVDFPLKGFVGATLATYGLFNHGRHVIIEHTLPAAGTR